ncbi:ester cyclase [Streptomyces uncialis]|uniref:ester cyclase n=1 Tax=Streptomyces uncialis TaxID=1048205 RepID=UPI00093B6544|nr:nuclear transport factor 2 family protein [Streptomyces uncialis]
MSGSAPAAGAGTAQRTREAVERYIAALNSGDPDRIAGRVTADFHNEHTASLGRSVRGRAAYRERLTGFLAEFEELRYEVEDLIVDGDRAAVAYLMTFRWSGAAHRPRIRIRGMFRFRVSGGEIAHRVDYWDSGTFQRQSTEQRRWRTRPEQDG